MGPLHRLGSSQSLFVGIVANEPSGDQLGAELMRAIAERRPGTRFEGVGGPQMIDAGCVSRVAMERLSVMGLVEVLRHLPELLRIRRELKAFFIGRKPDVFIGIDAPDFNLALEQGLKDAGIKTVHYVSPTVWAWRQGRVRHIRRSVDLLLSIFPFEAKFLEANQVPVRYVGHPLAERIDLEIDRSGARQRLGIAADVPLLAVLPGSRLGEVRKLGGAFVQTALWCRRQKPDLCFVTPMVNASVRSVFEQTLAAMAPDLPFTVVDGKSRDVLAAADVVLTASGTATFEAMLHKRPMVVGYKVNTLTYALAKGLHLVKVPYVAMANLLAGEELAPEYLQDECRAENLGPAVLEFFSNAQQSAAIAQRYADIHRNLRLDSGRLGADAILELIDQ